MADVFFSYARHDTARIEPIVGALEDEGFSVWWDRDMLPGTPGFDAELEKQITDAHCTIVAWSAASRISDWVREEALFAREQNKLVPILIEQVSAPFGWRRVQAENFVDWKGSRDGDGWQRLMLQVESLVGRKAKNHAPIDVAPTGQRSLPLTAIGIFLTLAVIALGVLIEGSVHMASATTGILSGFALTGLFFFFLFRQADFDLKPNLKALAARWFMPVEGKVRVNGAEAFLRIFEAVFGRRHFSWTCIWRSALTSAIALLLLFAISLTITGQFFKVVSHMSVGLVETLGLIISWNVLADYLALGETRLILRIGSRFRYAIVPLAILDFIATGALYIAVLYVFIYFSKPLDELLPQINPDPLRFIDYEFPVVISAGLGTTYLTSIWLWLAIIVPPIARLLLWSRRTGVTFLGQLFDTQERPFAALGFVTLVLFMIAGGITALVHAA